MLRKKNILTEHFYKWIFLLNINVLLYYDFVSKLRYGTHAQAYLLLYREINEAWWYS